MYSERRLANSLPTRSQIEGARCLRIALAALALIAPLCSTRVLAQVGNKNTGVVRGVVVNSVTHAPIARALVSSSDQRLAALTDSEGRFEFKLPETPAGDSPENFANVSTFFFARKPGFLPQNGNAFAGGKDLTLTLVPEAVIVGKVTLSNSEAPDTIFLQIFRQQVQDGRAHWFAAGGTETRSDGEFRFPELRAGTYKVLTRELLDRDPLSADPQGQLYGYPPVYGQNSPDFGSAATIQVFPGITTAVNLSVARKPYYSVHIPVINAAPNTGLNVNVSVLGRGGPGYSLGYNNREQAIEGMLPNGSYTLEALGYGQNGLAGTSTITVNGAAVRGPSLMLVPNASIRVDVNEQFTSTDNSGSITFNGPHAITLKGPRRYLNVILEPADDTAQSGSISLRSPTRTGDEALVIENAWPGRYWVRATSSRGYVASVRSGSVDLLHEPLVVAGGSSPPPIEITMRDDTAEIDGTVEGIPAPSSGARNVTDLNSRAAAFIYYIPTADSSGQFAESSSPDGTFSSPPLAPGAYRVLAFDHPQPELEYRNPEAMEVYAGKGPTVRVAGGQNEHVRLQLISSSEE